MVAAVFHLPPSEASDASAPTRMDSAVGASGAAARLPAGPAAGPTRRRWHPGAPLVRLLAALAGIALLVGVWALATQGRAEGSFPTPTATLDAAARLFAHPFYRNGPNDQGIGWNVLSSLQRVGMGFGLAALVGIPLGFMIGRYALLGAMLNPLIALLRPVSPLAWLPIGLLVFQAANPAAIWTIFICSIWPMIINTATGVQRVPQDYLNVARVLQLSEWRVFTRILLPATLPYVLTGVRLSVGTAWLVIVAAEMLTGGVGIGFWVWDEWNNLNVQHIIIAIVIIGLVGLLLETLLLRLARAVTHEEVRS
jgi:nitrate/nitrite transport system permease protein